MRKIATLLLAGAMVLSLTACGSSSSTTTTTVANTNSATSAPEQNANASAYNPVQDVFRPATSGVYATIKVLSSVKMDDKSAWLGLCPLGTDYIEEVKADEVDVIYFYADDRLEDSDPYVFACDFETVEDGKYALVVCTSDDENVGYVAIQMEMEKKDDKLTFDYSTAKLKNRPAK